MAATLFTMIFNTANSWCSSNGVYLCCEGTQFKSQQSHWLSWLRFFRGFPWSISANTGIVPH
jgi:hypothetical protein